MKINDKGYLTKNTDVISWINEIEDFMNKNSSVNYEIYDIDILNYSKVLLSLGLSNEIDDNICFCGNMNSEEVAIEITRNLIHRNENVIDNTTGKSKLLIHRVV